MKDVHKFLIISSLALLLTSCSAFNKRVFETKVEAYPEYTVEEVDKQAVAYIEEKAENPEVRVVGKQLSANFGEPVEEEAEVGVIIKDLKKKRSKITKAEDKVKEFLEDNEGEAIKGSGFSIFTAPLIILGILLIVALCLQPTLISLYIEIFKLGAGALKSAITLLFGLVGGTSKKLYEGIETYKKENPEAAEELTSILSKKMNDGDKAKIKNYREVETFTERE